MVGGRDSDGDSGGGDTSGIDSIDTGDTADTEAPDDTAPGDDSGDSGDAVDTGDSGGGDSGDSGEPCRVRVVDTVPDGDRYGRRRWHRPQLHSRRAPRPIHRVHLQHRRLLRQ
ncbi:MAG: hypothetical protein FJ102_06010 [Deltaproteobacteria bacterium]|nr:hypothetical protein [Deltaproteobacteria bacterium]